MSQQVEGQDGPRFTAIPYTIELRKCEEGMIEAAMQFNAVKYAAKHSIPLQHLRNVLTLNTHVGAPLVRIVEQMARDNCTDLPWSTPHTAILIVPTRVNATPLDTRRIFFTRSSKKPVDFPSLTWNTLLWSDFRKEFKGYGLTETPVVDASTIAPFDWSVNLTKEDTVYNAVSCENAVVDRVFAIVLNKKLYSDAEISALSAYALEGKQVNEYAVFTFSMLKYYMDHWLLHDVRDIPMFDLSKMAMLTPVDREKMFSSGVFRCGDSARVSRDEDEASLIRDVAAMKASLSAVPETDIEDETDFEEAGHEAM